MTAILKRIKKGSIHVSSDLLAVWQLPMLNLRGYLPPPVVGERCLAPKKQGDRIK